MQKVKISFKVRIFEAKVDRWFERKCQNDVMNIEY